MTGRKPERESTYEVSLDERWPSLVYAEESDGVVIPERLIKAHRKAREAIDKAELEIARWIKFTAPEVGQRDLGPLMDKLRPEEKS